MSQQTGNLPFSSNPDRWRWPINPAQYDRYPQLRKREYAELEKVFLRASGQLRKPNKAVLRRLMRPIDDVLMHLQAPRQSIDYEAIRFICLEMYRRNKTFWAWTQEEWKEIMYSDEASFAQQLGQTRIGNIRNVLLALVYLLDMVPDPSSLFSFSAIPPLARKIFGKEMIEKAVAQITTVRQSWGYQQKDTGKLTTCICYLLLRNRSPYLEDLRSELIEEIDRTTELVNVREFLFQVSRMLFTLGIIERALPIRREKWEIEQLPNEHDSDIDEEWQEWCERWRKQSPQQERQRIYYILLKAGRWLKVHHPDVNSPAQWTYDLAAEWIATVNEMKVGDWASQNWQRGEMGDLSRMGYPLRPHTKVSHLSALRAFLRDCQEWEWIPRRLNPARAFRIPQDLRTQTQPDPRVVDKPLWAKILWAAMNLEAADLPLNAGERAHYPLEMVRAIAMVWCFAALRSNEIVRLRVGCIRWQYDDVMIPETGEVLPRDASCFLDIPVNKTVGAYTKPVHPLVGKRIKDWEQIRPLEQPRDLDRKTSETVPYLFSYRGVRVSKAYINGSLIPLLCRKANIPEEDSRGAITSHRARTTIASQLYNAKNPLDIFQLQRFLGHKYISSTQHYIQVDPTKLALDVAKANYLEQNLATIEVLLDQEAVMSGAASRGECWKYYDLGHGFCTNPFWSTCAHRMACAKCPYYRPKASLADQLVEGKANLVRMLEFVQLTEEEKLLVTEGIELHQELIEKLADIPTPAGPTPRELEDHRSPETKVIPLKTIRRNKRKHHDEP